MNKNWFNSTTSVDKMNRIIKAFDFGKVGSFNTIWFNNGLVTLASTDIITTFPAPLVLSKFNGMFDSTKYKKIVSKFPDIDSVGQSSITFTDGNGTLKTDCIEKEREQNYYHAEFVEALDENKPYAILLSKLQIEIPIEDILAATKYCQQSISTETSRMYLMNYCIDMEDKSIITTDGRRLSKHDITISKVQEQIENTYLLKEPFIDLLNKTVDKNESGSISIGQDTSRMTIKFNDIIFSMTIPEGTFPNWKQVMPKSTSNNFSINATENKHLIKALTKVTSMNGGTLGTSLFVGRDKVLFVTDNKKFVEEWGKHEISIKLEKSNIDSMELMLSGKFMKDCLEKINGSVSVEFENEKSPFVFKDSLNEKALTLIMPINRENNI